MIEEDDQPVQAEAPSEAVAQQTDVSGRKPRGSRSQKTVATKPAAGRQVRRHDAKQRAEKLAFIDERLAKGQVSLKAAVAEAGISDQTYYQWKRAAKPVDTDAAIVVSPPSVGNELADLIKLEQENQRLRQLLAEKLRAENAELRRRLELD